MPHIDPYLYSQFNRPSWPDGSPNPRLSMLMELKQGHEGNIEAPDFQPYFQIGPFIGFSGTRSTLNYLSESADRDGILRIEASRPISRPAPANAGNSIGHAVTLPTHFADEADVIIGIIDAGIDVLSPAFLDDHGNSRIVAIWDQTERGVWSGPPGRARMPGYNRAPGKLYTHYDIQAMVLANHSPFRFSTHGTAVAGIAAGRATGTFNGGIAPNAKIIVVIPDWWEDQLLQNNNQRISMGYANSCLSAVHFVREYAEYLNLPSVANISLGSNPGAHDGTTLLEKAIDSELDNGFRNGFAVVKSAGNAATSDNHSISHLDAYDRMTISWGSTREAGINWQTEDYLELWYDHNHNGRPPASRVEFRLSLDNSHTSSAVSRVNRRLTGSFAGSISYEMHLEEGHPDNGLARLSVRVFYNANVSAIVNMHLEVSAPRGAVNRPSGPFHAWLDGLDGRTARFTTPNTECTLTIPGTSTHIITVGATDPGNGNARAVFSSLGPPAFARHDKPEIYAPGVGINSIIHTAATGTVDGTSFSAPQITGALALALSWRHKDGRKVTCTTLKNSIVKTATPLKGINMLAIDAFLNDICC